MNAQKQMNILTKAGLCLGLFMVGLLVGGATPVMNPAENPNQDRSIVSNGDIASMWFPARQDRGNPEATPRILEDIIDEHAKAQAEKRREL